MVGRVRVLGGFAAFGAFWGAWGATLPAIQSHAGVDDGQLGIALLCIGAGALASMRPAGTLVDRWGAPALPAVLAAFGAAALLPALATSTAALGAALLVLGATSGAVDVAINAEGVRSEAATGRPVLSLAHGTFSACVVAGSLAAGGLRAAGAGPEACSPPSAPWWWPPPPCCCARPPPGALARPPGPRCATCRVCSSSSAGCARWPSSSRTPGRAGARCTSSPTSMPPPPSARSPPPCSPAPRRSRAWAATRWPAACAS